MVQLYKVKSIQTLFYSVNSNYNLTIFWNVYVSNEIKHKHSTFLNNGTLSEEIQRIW